MPQKDPSRTEKPTPKRIRDARKKGNVAKSQEISTTVTVLAGTCIAALWFGTLGKEMMEVFRFFFTTAIIEFEPEPANVHSMFVRLSFEMAKMVLPIMFVVGLAVFVALRIQVGKLWTFKPLKPKLKKFNPLPGIKRMFFSLQTFTRLGKSILKALVIGAAPAMVVMGELDTFPSLYYVDAITLSAYILKMGLKMVIYALAPMVIIAVVDLVYTRWDYIENLKMTKQEVKDEWRQQEGDPQVKQKQRQKMMQMSQRRMMQAVPTADVVITNPTHIAVALKYDQIVAPAPMVVAKGADKVAEKIKEIARENRVPIRENRPLARALYAQAEIGDVIPEDLYKAVATILAQLWQSKGAMPGGVKPPPGAR